MLVSTDTGAQGNMVVLTHRVVALQGHPFFCPDDCTLGVDCKFATVVKLACEDLDGYKAIDEKSTCFQAATWYAFAKTKRPRNVEQF